MSLFGTIAAMMNTERIYISSVDDTEAIQRAGRLLRNGAIVAFPTETVYGLGAKAEPAVLSRLNAIKGRPADKRYSLHIGCLEDLARYVPRPTLQAKKLMQTMWPGPMTIIFEPDKESLEKIRAALPPKTYELLYRDGSLGVRYPDNPVACAVLKAAVAPIVAPSANPAAQAPAVSADEVAAYFNGHIEMIVEAPGSCRHRLNSTVVRVGEKGVTVLREGVYSRPQTLEATRVHLLFVCTGNTCRSPMAEALCRKYLADKFNCDLDAVEEFGYTIISAGVAAFESMPASRHALEVSRQKGTPLDNHRSSRLTAAMIQQADLIFVMNESHLQYIRQTAAETESKCYLLDASGEIADPVGYDVEVYRSCAEQIERSINERMNALL